MSRSMHFTFALIYIHFAIVTKVDKNDCVMSTSFICTYFVLRRPFFIVMSM